MSTKEMWHIPREKMQLTDVLSQCGYVVSDTGSVQVNDGRLSHIGAFEAYAMGATPRRFTFSDRDYNALRNASFELLFRVS
jgi:hypothetical protein